MFLESGNGEEVLPVIVSGGFGPPTGSEPLVNTLTPARLADMGGERPFSGRVSVKAAMLPTEKMKRVDDRIVYVENI